LFFLARDAEERQKWLCNLEDAISFNTVRTVCFFGFIFIFVEKYFIDQDNLSLPNSILFQRKILEADGFLQLLIEQVNVRVQIYR